MLLSKNRLPFYIILIPVIWSVIGFSAAYILNIYEDSALLISGVLIIILNFVKPKKFTTGNAMPKHLAASV